MFWTNRAIRKLKIEKIAKWINYTIILILLGGFFTFQLTTLINSKPDNKLRKGFQTKAKLIKYFAGKVNKDTKFMCRGISRPITYYLRLPFWNRVYFPYAPPEKIIKYAKQENVKYIFVEQEDLRYNTYLKPFLFGEVEHPYVKRLMYMPSYLIKEVYSFAIYEVFP